MSRQIPSRSICASSVTRGSSTSLNNASPPRSTICASRTALSARIARAAAASASRFAAPSSTSKVSCPPDPSAVGNVVCRNRSTRSETVKARCPASTRYAESSMSAANPAISSPRAPNASIAAFAACMTLAWVGSLSHVAKAASSPTPSWAGSNQIASPPAAASATA